MAEVIYQKETNESECSKCGEELYACVCKKAKK